MKLAPLAMILLLGGCSALGALGNASKPIQIYELRAPNMPQARAARPLELTVETPETSGALATDAILIRPSSLQASYLADGQWSDDLPLMVQTMLVRALQSTGGYSYVGREPLGLDGDYALLTDIVDFQAEILPVPESPTPARAVMATQTKITLLIQIVRERDARIIATRRFSTTARAIDDSAASITAAMEGALDTMLPELGAWVMSKTGVARR